MRCGAELQNIVVRCGGERLGVLHVGCEKTDSSVGALGLIPHSWWFGFKKCARVGARGRASMGE